MWTNRKDHLEIRPRVRCVVTCGTVPYGTNKSESLNAAKYRIFHPADNNFQNLYSTSRKHIPFGFSPTWPIWKQQARTFWRRIIQNLVWVLDILTVLSAVCLSVNGLVVLEDRVSFAGKNRNYCPRYHLQSIRGADPAPTSSGRGGPSVRAAGLNSLRNIVKNQNKYKLKVFSGTPKIFFRTRKETSTETLF